jgi:hypothetical protein
MNCLDAEGTDGFSRRVTIGTHSWVGRFGKSLLRINPENAEALAAPPRRQQKERWVI